MNRIVLHLHFINRFNNSRQQIMSDLRNPALDHMASETCVLLSFGPFHGNRDFQFKWKSTHLISELWDNVAVLQNPNTLNVF